jgi:diguanylate cyclase (GGDEF)-like protein
MDKGIVKKHLNIEKDIKSRLTQIKQIIKGDESESVKYDSIQAIFNDLAEEIIQAKADNMYEDRTGLLSAGFGDEFLKKEIESAKRDGTEVSIALLDIDFLKFINDTFGHVVGTKVIIKISDVIKEVIRKSDVASRYGGDEFLIIFPRTDHAKATQAVERIKKEVSKILIDGKVRISIASGVATCSGKDQITPHQLIERADKELYRAKSKRVNINL